MSLQIQRLVLAMSASLLMSGCIFKSEFGFLNRSVGPLPLATIASPIPGSEVGLTETIEGVCESGWPVVLTGEITASVTTPCNAGQFSVVVNFNALPMPGTRDVIATQTDTDGNSDSDSTQYNIPLAPPVGIDLSIDTPVSGATVDTTVNVTVTGQCTYHSVMSDVVLTGDIAASVTAVCTSGGVPPYGGTYSAEVVFNETPIGGPRNLTATQTNTDTSASASDVAVYTTTVPADPMITVWNMGALETLTLPINTGYAYDIVVNWGDGSPLQSYTQADPVPSHLYTDAGVYTVQITGTIRAWRINLISVPERNRLLQVINLGNMGWQNLNYGFTECANLTTFQGGGLSNAVDLSYIFKNSPNVVPDTSTWDTSNLVNMMGMFEGATSATPDTSSWITSNVVFMSWMFSNAHSANPDTSGWDTSNVTTMAGMFQHAISATPVTTTNGNIWNTSNVGDMQNMFLGATLAAPDTSGWDTSNVTNMRLMFESASNANPDTSGWETANVQDMEMMFSNTPLANPTTTHILGTDIWNTSNVTSMRMMFLNAVIANPDTSNWDTSSVTTMRSMFASAYLATPDTSSWDTSNVEDMESMFAWATNANPVTSSWNLSSLTNGLWEVFTGTNISITNYSDFLNRLEATNTCPSAGCSAWLPLGSSARYNAGAATARQNLILRGWSISDAGPE